MEYSVMNNLPGDLKIVKELVYDPCKLELTHLKVNVESTEYDACSFELNGYNIQYRASKITPTKVGQFVTVWKRNKDGITEPYNVSDDIDFFMITSRSGGNLGQFIFPASVLAEKGIITQNEKEGKHGIRVYPPWDIAPNKQAEKTQSWQSKYFLSLNDHSVELDFITKIFEKKITTNKELLVAKKN